MQVSIGILLGYRDCVGYIAAIFRTLRFTQDFVRESIWLCDLILVLP